MTLTQIKKTAEDCKKTHRWALTRSDFDLTKTVQYRIIGIGRQKIRLMSASGTVFTASPESIIRVW